jgi:hypothetical protein
VTSDQPRRLTSREAAEFIGVPDNRLRQWRKRGTGPRFSKVGVAVVYRRADLERWLADVREESA